MVWRARACYPRAARGSSGDLGASAVIIVGLTGSIGMGKSTAAVMLRRLRIPLFDADQVVHRLLAPGGAAVQLVCDAFPGIRTESGAIDRALLGRLVFADAAALDRLERILHPMVAAKEKWFLKSARARGQTFVVLDVPLLFESGTYRRCNYVVVVSAPRLVQRQRVLRRPGMTEIRFSAILQKQMSDWEKRRRADFVVPTGLGKKLTLRRLRAIVSFLRGPRARCTYRQRRAVRERRGRR
jgi:dephospho-CoA kinase